MAMTTTVLHVSPAGNRLRAIVSCAFDNSYTTGGYSLTPANLAPLSAGASRSPAFTKFDAVLGVGQSNGGDLFYDTSGQKLKVFGTRGTEGAHATDLSADTGMIEIVGR